VIQLPLSFKREKVSLSRRRRREEGKRDEKKEKNGVPYN
jgi:hypothetical protein